MLFVERRIGSVESERDESIGKIFLPDFLSRCKKAERKIIDVRENCHGLSWENIPNPVRQVSIASGDQHGLFPKH